VIALYIIGEPGVGKTTLMNGLLTNYRRGDARRLGGLLWGEPLHLSGQPLGVVLGRARGAFSGTDALGMAVQRDAVRWARHEAEGEVYGEGQRLANVAFLTALAERGRVLVLHLWGPAVAERQRRARGSQQAPSWLLGSRTRAVNLAAALRSEGIPLGRVGAGPAALHDARAQWEAFQAAVEV